MLPPGAAAPDFPVGEGTLHRLLDGSSVALFFFPKAFTSG